MTDFCYAAGSRSTTVTADLGTANTGTSDTMVVASIDALGAVVGDYIQVTAAGTAVTPGVGEYMKVTAIAASTFTLTVIRNVAPNCLGYIYKNGVAAPAASIVTLLHPAFDTVQLVDSVTKQASQAAGADGNPMSSGSCATVSLKVAEANDGSFALDDNFLSFDAGVVADLPKVGGLVVGDLINMANEYMLVTTVTKTNAAGTEGTLTVVRDVLPPCPSTTGGTAAAQADNVAINKVVTGGCYAMPATTARALRATITAFQTTITVDANTGMQVGGYLFHDGTTGHTGTTGEYMLITDIDGTILTVVRNIAPPCVVGHTVLTSTASTGGPPPPTLSSFCPSPAQTTSFQRQCAPSWSSRRERPSLGRRMPLPWCHCHTMWTSDWVLGTRRPNLQPSRRPLPAR